tara:strand:- start:423 stop:557 length:135 start_codon:yes stop_codon:yes gene_type:complete
MTLRKNHLFKTNHVVHGYKVLFDYLVENHLNKRYEITPKIKNIL